MCDALTHIKTHGKNSPPVKNYHERAVMVLLGYLSRLHDMPVYSVELGVVLDLLHTSPGTQRGSYLVVVFFLPNNA